MATYAELCALIADDIDDTTGEYSTQIKRAVLAAIRYCERFTFYFNESRDITFQTVSGQRWYDATSNANIPSLVVIQAAWCEQADGRRVELRPATPQELELVSDNSASRGEPYAWTYFAQKIGLYPIPDAQTYTIRLQVGPYRLATLTADSDANAWTTEAVDMVKARAKYILAKDTLKDAALATEAFGDFNDQFSALKGETSSRNGSGCIKATSF